MNKPTGMSEAITRAYSYMFAIKCSLIIIFSAILTAFLLYFSLQGAVGSSYTESYNLISRLQEELLHKSAVIYITTAFFQIVGIVIIALLYSHRVAGPLHRIGIFARKIASGNLTGNVKLRQHDAIHPMADDLNSIISSYKEILKQLEIKMKELKDTVSVIDNTARTSKDNALQHTKTKVSEKANEIKEILFDIKL